MAGEEFCLVTGSSFIDIYMHLISSLASNFRVPPEHVLVQQIDDVVHDGLEIPDKSCMWHVKSPHLRSNVPASSMQCANYPTRSDK